MFATYVKNWIFEINHLKKINYLGSKRYRIGSVEVSRLCDKKRNDITTFSVRKLGIILFTECYTPVQLIKNIHYKWFFNNNNNKINWLIKVFIYTSNGTTWPALEDKIIFWENIRISILMLLLLCLRQWRALNTSLYGINQSYLPTRVCVLV